MTAVTENLDVSTLDINDLQAAFRDATGQTLEPEEVQQVAGSVGFKRLVAQAADEQVTALRAQLEQAQQDTARKDAELAQAAATLEARAAIAPVGEDLPHRVSPDAAAVQDDGSVLVVRAGRNYSFSDRDAVARAYSDALAAHEAYLRKDAEDAARAKARAELVARIAAAPAPTGVQLTAEQINATLDLIAAAHLIVAPEPASA
jgi:hypothetical protein